MQEAGLRGRYDHTSSGLSVPTNSPDRLWTSASRSRFFGNRVRLAWTMAFDAWASCHWRTARMAASQPRFEHHRPRRLADWINPTGANSESSASVIIGFPIAGYNCSSAWLGKLSGTDSSNNKPTRCRGKLCPIYPEHARRRSYRKP